MNAQKVPLNNTTVPIIGRDRLLANARRYLNTNQNGLYLIGNKGTGKSTILETLQSHYPKSCLVNCRETKGDILRAIIRTYQINIGTANIARATVGDMQKAILQAEAGTIFLDNAEELKPALRGLLEPLRDREWRLILATTGIKKDYERLYWGAKRFEIKPLRADQAKQMAATIIKQEGLTANPAEVARISRGNPARLVHLARGEVVPMPADEWREEDAINIAPLLLILLMMAIIIKTIGIGVEQKDMYIIGGVMMAIAFPIRFFMTEARKK